MCCSCAELLVLKAELELMKGGGEAGVLDLEQVRHLLDLCTGDQIFWTACVLIGPFDFSFISSAAVCDQMCLSCYGFRFW